MMKLPLKLSPTRFESTVDHCDVTQAINSYSANISAGQLRTNSGIVSVRVENQYYSGDEFKQIPLKLAPAALR